MHESLLGSRIYVVLGETSAILEELEKFGSFFAILTPCRALRSRHCVRRQRTEGRSDQHYGGGKPHRLSRVSGQFVVSFQLHKTFTNVQQHSVLVCDGLFSSLSESTQNVSSVYLRTNIEDAQLFVGQTSEQYFSSMYVIDTYTWHFRRCCRDIANI